jgi:quinol monooxygenase YgiN
MTAYNIVRMRVKPGHEQELLEHTKAMDKNMTAHMKQNGWRRGALIKTGERSYCFLGEWESMDSIVKSRPDMIKDLDSMRSILEDLGGGLGVTDPVSGDDVLESS